MALLLNAAGSVILSSAGAAIAVGVVSGSGALSLQGVDLPSDQIYQSAILGGGSASVIIQVSYTGATSTIQASAIPFGAAGVGGATWQPLTVVGGTASGSVTVPRGGPYAVVIRDSGSGASWTSGQRFYVGDNGAFYGQSNMLHLFGSGAGGYESSQPLGRRQAGVGWNVISNSPGETFPAVPNTVYGGKTNPALGLPGEPQGSVTQGQSMGWLAKRIIAQSGSPFGIFPYAVPGTDTTFWAPGSGTGWTTMLGGAGVVGIFNAAPYTFDACFAVRYQGENNGSAGGVAAFPAALIAERNGWWSATGRDAGSFRFGIVSLGPSAGYGAVGTFGQLRAAALAFIADPANGAYYAGNPIDGTLPVGETVHLDQPSLVRLAYRIALTTAIALGHSVIGNTGVFTTGAGPRVTSISRSGNVLLLTVGDMDGATSLVTGDGGTTGTGLGGFRVYNSAGVSVPVGATLIAGSVIRLTLPPGVSYPVSIDHQMGDAPYGQPPVAAQIVYGNNVVPGDTIGAPLWPFSGYTVA